MDDIDRALENHAKGERAKVLALLNEKGPLGFSDIQSSLGMPSSELGIALGYLQAEGKVNLLDGWSATNE